MHAVPHVDMKDCSVALSCEHGMYAPHTVDSIEAVASDDDAFTTAYTKHVEEAFAIAIQRRRAYGRANIIEQGIAGVLGRMAHDKMARIKRYAVESVVAGYHNEHGLDAIERTVSDAQLRDDLHDAVNYALIALMLLDGEW